MIIVYIILALVSIICLYFLYRFAKPDGTMTVDSTDPDDVKIDLTGINVLDKEQQFFVLRVTRYKTK